MHVKINSYDQLDFIVSSDWHDSDYTKHRYQYGNLE